MPNLKVSIVMPVFNRASILPGVIRALLNQTYKNIEFVLVDDGSSDNTSVVIQSFPEVKLVKRENGGCAAARNTGIANASGDVILFIDSDVFIPPNLAETHAKYHAENPKRIVQGQLVRIVKLENAFKTPFTMSTPSRTLHRVAIAQITSCGSVISTSSSRTTTNLPPVTPAFAASVGPA